MTQRTVPALFIALALGCAGSIGHAQTTIITDVPQAAPAPVAPAPSAARSVAPVARISNPNGVIVAPATSQLRTTGGNVTVVQSGIPGASYVQPYTSYPNSYPAYAPSYNRYPYNSYPAYPNYGTGTTTYGSSVTIATPGFQDNNYRLFPYATTVTTWGSNSGYNCPPQYRPGNSYPAYPTYVPGPAINGYRGAANGEAARNNYQNYNGPTMVNGSYVGPNGMFLMPNNYGRGRR
jgi:hypothetical protein